MATKKVGKSVAVIKQEEPQELSIESVIQSAIANKTPVDVMERLLAMRTQLKQERAKEAYDGAMAAFQSECPTIVKTKEVRTGGQVAYRYAPIESIVAQVKDLLMKHGFSYSTGMELMPSGVKVKMRVTHAGGHSEEFFMEVPNGNKTAMMSQAQLTAAATTFAKRYAFCNAFGILTGDEDNDARAVEAQKERMDSYQVTRVVPDESDEAGGYVSHPPADFEEESNRVIARPHKMVVPNMDSTNDAHAFAEDKQEGDTGLKMQIARLMKDKRNFVMLGKTREQCEEAIMAATGIALAPYNYGSIIHELESL